MAETPDFEMIALTAIDASFDQPSRVFSFEEDLERCQHAIAEQLRLVWNARGAADIVKLEAELSSMMGVSASAPYVKNLDRALRALDR